MINVSKYKGKHRVEPYGATQGQERVHMLIYRITLARLREEVQRDRVE